MSENNRQGYYRQRYTPTLKSGNPEKKPKTDWWDEVCKAHGEKNHFPPKWKTYKGDSLTDD